MALFNMSITRTKRSAEQSKIVSAAYRPGERLYSEYYGKYSDYICKNDVICSGVLLPSHAPPEYADRQTLWNAVEKADRGKNTQLTYSFDIALQNEFSLEENITLARQFLLEQFVSRGMTVDTLKGTLDSQIARMKEIRRMYDYSATFQNLKPVLDGLQKINFEKSKAKYKAEHADELKMFYTAKRKLTEEFPDGKVDMKKLSAEWRNVC